MTEEEKLKIVEEIDSYFEMKKANGFNPPEDIFNKIRDEAIKNAVIDEANEVMWTIVENQDLLEQYSND